MSSTPTTFKGLVGELLGIINILIPLIFAVVFVFLVWKIFDSWVLNGADEGKRKEGGQYAMVATIVFVLMISAWGIIAIVKNTIFGE